jgi:hypothetical protein
LDGDEYSVIWDPGLYLERNEPAFDYTSEATEPIAVEEENLRKQMADFFVKYISHDSIGKLATAFLVNSDIFGIESKVCDVVAKKHMKAVDFPKTGNPPDRLQRGDAVNGLTSEDPMRKPDYMEQMYKPTYISQRLNGRIFQLVKLLRRLIFEFFSRIKAIDDVLEMSIEDQLNQPPEKDSTFQIDGVTQEHMDIARNNFNTYKALMEVSLCWESLMKDLFRIFFNDSVSVLKPKSFPTPI